MVNDEWSGAEALENAFRVADEELRKVERERDAAVARADQLRDERDDAVQSCMAVGRERDEWKARAEAAEARTAVTREDVEKAVRRGHNMLNAEVGVINEMCDLLGIEARQDTDPDPVEVAIRDGLYLWGFTDKAVQEIAASVRHVIGQEANDE